MGMTFGLVVGMTWFRLWCGNDIWFRLWCGNDICLGCGVGI